MNLVSIYHLKIKMWSLMLLGLDPNVYQQELHNFSSPQIIKIELGSSMAKGQSFL